MTTYYVDAENGNDSNSGLTPLLAKKTYNSARLATTNGFHSILLKRGQIHLLAAEGSARNGTSADLPFYIGAYGEGSKPIFRPNWTPSSSTSLFWLLSGSQYIKIEDIVFDAADTPFVNTAFNVMLVSASDITGITVRRCEFTRSGSSGTSLFWNGGVNWAANTIRDVVYEDCLAYDNGTHGFIGGGLNAVMRRCKSFRNGRKSGGHGFSIQGACRTTVTSGWTLVSGTIYSRAVTNEVWGVFSSITTHRALVKNTSTPTTPASGEYGWQAGTLYVNFGTNPNGPTVDFCQTKNSITWEDCEAFDNYAFYPYPYVEGQGFQFDDWTSFSYAYRCKSYNNGGAGFSFNNTAECSAVSLVAYNNARRGVTIQASRNVSVVNPTLYENNKGGMRYPSSENIAVSPDQEEIALSQSPSTNIQNPAVKARSILYAINSDTTSITSSTCNSCMGSGMTSIFISSGIIAGTNNVVQDNLLLDKDTFRIKANSPLIANGSKFSSIVLDNTGKPFKRIPSIGAFEYHKRKTKFKVGGKY